MSRIVIHNHLRKRTRDAQRFSDYKSWMAAANAKGYLVESDDDEDPDAFLIAYRNGRQVGTFARGRGGTLDAFDPSEFEGPVSSAGEKAVAIIEAGPIRWFWEIGSTKKGPFVSREAAIRAAREAGYRSYYID